MGMTGDLKRRIKEHRAGSNTSTRNRGEFKLIYYEAYRNKMDAFGREKFLKSGAGRRFLKKQIKFYILRKTVGVIDYLFLARNKI